MRDYLKFYINGAWVDPVTPKSIDVINPATESVAGHISMGSAADVDRAVGAARRAFGAWSVTRREERIEALEKKMDQLVKATNGHYAERDACDPVSNLPH